MATPRKNRPPCLYCPAKVRWATAKTCAADACQRKWNIGRVKAWREHNPKPERVYKCHICGEAIVIRPGTACGPRSLCDHCRSEGPSAAVIELRRGVESYACAGCGDSFERKPTKGQRPRWCPACAKGKGWRQANRDLRSAAWHRRRVMLINGEVEDFTPAEIYERDRWRCGICRGRVGKSLKWPHPRSASIDHIIPVIEGGGHVRANVRLAHLVCNTSRGARGGGEQLMLIG